MNDTMAHIVDLVIILVFMAGFAQFRSPITARRGNMIAALALAAAALVVVLRNDIEHWPVIAGTLAVGSLLGWVVAARVTMLQIPPMVALQHGVGGVAAFLVSVVELCRTPIEGLTIGKISGLAGLILGAATFSGSMIASGKLAGILKSTPVSIRGHSLLVILNLVFILAVAAVVGVGGAAHIVVGAVLLIVASIILGAMVSIRVGGADMPVLISVLNALAGLAAAFCGVIIESQLLIACGATVAASGTILTHIMCKGMNRGLSSVLLGSMADSKASQSTWLPSDTEGANGEPMPALAKEQEISTDPWAEAVSAALAARRVIIVPGYGMALGQAQFDLVKLADLLEERGASVCFAIHPVAGRMPGHMNVLLAEADVSYDKLMEMDVVNEQFKDTDLALVVGACDVVNPAAMKSDGSPISGMPILRVGEARRVVVCNLDANPGYSGVENTLYSQPNVILLFGNAKETVERIVLEVQNVAGDSHPA